MSRPAPAPAPSAKTTADTKTKAKTRTGAKVAPRPKPKSKAPEKSFAKQKRAVPKTIAAPAKPQQVRSAAARRTRSVPTAAAVAQARPQAANDPLWTAVDRYLVDLLVPQDSALTDALRDSDAAGLPPINVAPNQGKLLHLLAKISGAKRILEIGTLGGYSAIWLARALPPDGQLVTLEIDARHAEVARHNLARAGLTSVSVVLLGRAVESLSRLVSDDTRPFDLVFIDADKPSNPEYFLWALKLTRPGGVIIVDNVVRRGLVADADSTDANVLGVRRLNELIATEPRVSATSVQTVGSKGHDGFTLILVNT